jgi:hypothetical protein
MDKIQKVGFIGYSAKKFDENKAKDAIKLIFDELEPYKNQMEIVSGLTNMGIPKLVYEEAVKRGMKTVGIACEKAYDEECFDVDKKIIKGTEWGDESDTFLKYINILIKLGGGKQTEEEYKNAKNYQNIDTQIDVPFE